MMISQACRSLVFRPFRDNLLSPGANLWLVVMWLLVSLTSFAEAWVAASIAGYCGATSAMAGLLAVLVGLVIYLIDMTLVLLDVTSKPGATWIQRHWKLTFNIAVRLIIVAFTVYFTLPAATLTMVNEEIEEEYRGVWIRQVDEAQKKELAKLEAELTAARQERDNLRQAWTEEVDGRSGSRLVGVGPRARKIERDQKLAQERVARAESSLSRFSTQMARADLESRSRALSVSTPSLTLAERYRILDSIRQRPGVRQKTRLVEAYLGLLIGSLLLLKVLAPASVRVYLSEAHQQAWLRARAGGYDYLTKLDPGSISPTQLGPLDFFKWIQIVLPQLERLRIEICERSEKILEKERLRPRVMELQQQLEAAIETETRAARVHSAADAEVARLTLRQGSRLARRESVAQVRTEAEARFDILPSEELAFVVARAGTRLDELDAELEELGKGLAVARGTLAAEATAKDRCRLERERVEHAYRVLSLELLSLQASIESRSTSSANDNHRTSAAENTVFSKQPRSA